MRVPIAPKAMILDISVAGIVFLLLNSPYRVVSGLPRGSLLAKSTS